MAKKNDKPVMTEEQKRIAGQLAGQSSRQYILDACQKEGLTVEKVAKTIVEGLEAKQVKVQMNMQGKWVVSKEFDDIPTRLKAVERAEVLLDLKPTEKKQVDLVATLTDEQINNKLRDILGGE